MINALFAVGLSSAVVLLALLVATLIDRRHGIWPTPGKGTWQSVVFWSLFRILNVSTLGLAAIAPGGDLAIPWLVRDMGAVVFLICAGLYAYALFALGRANTYCRRDGLVTHGLYRWTRNPQYAAVILAYVGLAVASGSSVTSLLTAALIAVYVLMARAEESWLSQHYGDAYRRYARNVPRFFDIRRLRMLWRIGRFAFARRESLYALRAVARDRSATMSGRR
jgi:protein-S-isoprenylcysteine O-methyltransferase Ste14